MPEVWKSYGLTASTNGQLFSTFLADAQHYQDTDDHEEAAEQDGRSDLKPFVKAMAHPGDGIQGRDPSRHPAVES